MHQPPALNLEHISSELTQTEAVHHINSSVVATGGKQLSNAQKQGM